MLKLDAFDLRDINKFEIILSQLVSEGVVDVRLGQELVHNYLANKRLEFKNNDKARKLHRKTEITNRNYAAKEQDARKENWKIKPIEIFNCPSCKEKSAELHYMPSCQRRSMGGDYKYLVQCSCGWSKVYKEIPTELVK